MTRPNYQTTLSDPFNPSPYPPPTRFAWPSSYNQGYDERELSGDIPLLRSSGSLLGTTEPPQMPGTFDEDDEDAQDQQSTNIRYGRIPQRVPRRYKKVQDGQEV